VCCITGIGSVLDEWETHRPLIACTLIGLILGDLRTGVIIGGTLEMIALGWMNIGASMAPDTALASIIATILVIAGKQSIPTGVALAIPLAAAGQMLTILARTITITAAHKADSYGREGNLRGIDICHVAAFAVQALRVAIPGMAIAIFVQSNAVQNILNAIPIVITQGLRVAGGMIVVVGYAMVINMMEARYLMPFFFLGFVLAAFTTINLVGFGIVGVVAAITYIQLSPKYSHSGPALAVAGGTSNNELDDDLD